jgi:hypothetical protein
MKFKRLRPRKKTNSKKTIILLVLLLVILILWSMADNILENLFTKK